MRNAVFVDTSILLLAAGQSPDRTPCAEALLVWRAESVDVHVAAETIQEFAFHRLRKSGQEQAIAETHALIGASVVHALDRTVLERGLDLMEAGLRGRDAMIAATALVGGFREIVSADSDFDETPGLRRVDPRRQG